MKIYGPYLRKDGRKHVVIIKDDGSRQTKSYPRLLLEQHLGRELTIDETVDHIDNDFTNDSIDNLQILSLSDNAKKQAALLEREVYEFDCPNCGTKAFKFMNQIQGNWKKGKTGPYCSRKCAGQYTYKNPWIRK